MNRLFATGNNYSTFTRSLFDIPEFVKMSGKQLVLFLWLNRQADRYGNGQKVFTNQDIADAVGIHVNKVPSVRKRLEALRLLEVEKKRDRKKKESGYVYWMLNAFTRRPIGEPVHDADEDGEDCAAGDADSVLEEQVDTAPIVDQQPAVSPVPATASGHDESEIVRLKAIYVSCFEPTDEEVEIGVLLRGCRKDQARTAELRQKRGALQALRKEARDEARIAYEEALTNPQV